MNLRSRAFLVFADLSMIWLGLLLAILLRTEINWGRTLRFLEEQTWFFICLSIIIVCVFELRGLYSRDLRYLAVDDAIDFLTSLLICFVPFQILALLARGFAFPRGGLTIAFFPILILILGYRLSIRIRRENTAQTGPDQRFLVVGEGDAVEVAVRQLKKNGGVAIGWVGLGQEDSPLSIRGCPYLGKLDNLEEAVQQGAPQAVILAGLDPATNAKVVKILTAANVELRRLPPLSELLAGELELDTIRPLQLEDLLEREPVRIDRSLLGEQHAGKVVLVTGAGGSIGSEICRQLLALSPSKIVLFGRGENSIHEILIELRAMGQSDVVVFPFVGDVKDTLAVRRVFRECQPNFVYHAAAHKHVPLMESRVVEACANNILGTINVLEACRDSQVERFIALSTDKAVSPSSVMGATKRVMEMLVQDCGLDGVAAVRFGNVLGSRGSVVPTLQRQIAAGGPLTVTSKKMERYFMTIPEAVALVLGAGTMARDGELYVLEMGRPVKIIDLVENLIRLSGLRPGEDIEIKITGARPGEKLTEVLLSDSELGQSSDLEGIMKVTGGGDIPSEWFHEQLSLLRGAIELADDDSARQVLFNIVNFRA